MRLSPLFALALCASVASASIIPLDWVPKTGTQTRNYKLGTRSIAISSQNAGDYTGPITIGSSNVRVVLDTGSSNLAVAGSSCSCNGVTPYSMTGRNTGNPISVQYGSGSWSGTVYSDQVTFGGYSQTVDFGVITYQSTFFSPNSPYSGILGLAFQGIAENGIPPLLKSYGVGVIGLQLCRGNNGQESSAGRMALGSGDATNNGLYSGQINYTPLTGSQGYYTVTAQSANVAGSYAMGQFSTIIDSGTNSLVLPGTLYNALVNQIQSSTGSSLSSYSACPSLSSLPNLDVVFNDNYGNPFTLSIRPTDYCPNMNGVRRFDVSSNSQFHILGTPLLNHYYGVFDKTNRQVGFAPLSGCGNSFEVVKDAVVDGTTKENDTGLSSHAIAGIAAGSTLAVLAAVVAVIALLRRRGDKAAQEFQQMEL